MTGMRAACATAELTEPEEKTREPSVSMTAYNQ